MVPIDIVIQWTDNFSEKRVVGEGTFGKVFEGIVVSHCDKLRALAVKQLTPDMIPAGGEKHFKREISVLNCFRHPNIIKLLGYTEIQAAGPKVTCLIYEMGSRGSVASILRNDDKARLFAWRERMHVTHGVVSALNYLHCHKAGSPVFHRDVKSDNVVVTADYTAKLIDCGLAKYKPDGAGGTVTATTGVAVGTPGYMCRNYIDTNIFDAKSEIYSVGILLLEIMTGRVQQRGMSLYTIYIDDEEELAADTRAGSWQKHCFKDMDNLARECLEKYKKRIGCMMTVLRRLKVMLDTHCQFTDSERAKARELVMLQQEIDEAKVKGMQAERLEKQLKVQAAQLTAMREAERQAQAARDREEVEKAERMRRCVVCWDKCDKDEGVQCTAGHFMCGQCLNSEVKEQASIENMGAFKRAKLCVKCRACTYSDSWLDIALLTRHLKNDGFVAYLRAREAVLVREALQEQEEGFKEQIKVLREQMVKLATGGDAAVLQHRRQIIEDVLTLKCPRQHCKRAFIDFDGCFALKCDACHCGFCAYCLQDCGHDAHRHVANCMYNIAPGRDVFAAVNVFEQAQRERRTRLLRQYVREHVNVGTRAALIRAMGRDLADLGIDPAQVL
jgi:hypothetical protein